MCKHVSHEAFNSLLLLPVKKRINHSQKSIFQFFIVITTSILEQRMMALNFPLLSILYCYYGPPGKEEARFQEVKLSILYCYYTGIEVRPRKYVLKTTFNSLLLLQV